MRISAAGRSGRNSRAWTAYGLLAMRWRAGGSEPGRRVCGRPWPVPVGGSLGWLGWWVEGVGSLGCGIQAAIEWRASADERTIRRPGAVRAGVLVEIRPGDHMLSQPYHLHTRN